jgi:hypothetical protein
MRTSVKYICVDNANVRRKLPAYIKSVPTLVSGSKVIVGNQINDFLQITTLVEKNKAEAPMAPMAPMASQPQKEPDDFGGPNAFLTSEMSNFSDPYSFLGIDTSAQGNGGDSMNHCFEFLNGNNDTTVANQNMNPMQSNCSEIQNSDKMDELNKKMDEMMSRRELDVPNTVRRI